MSSKNTMTSKRAGSIWALAIVLALDVNVANAQLAEEIVVTGTRIKQKNVLATSPIVTLTGEDIATRGVTRVEDLINELPQVFASQGSNISNGATGIATVNLRGLGSERTLVLIDGRRMASGTVNQIAADLNQIPAALVKNIDVLTGGSGAVYGSDALAGVVNFQMERNFEGLRLDAQIGVYQHNNNNRIIQTALSDAGELTQSLTGSQLDGFTRDFTLVYGRNFNQNKGNITAYLGYRNIDGILQKQRDYSGCLLGSGRNSDGVISCSGSLVSAQGLFTDNTFGANGFLFTLDPDTGNSFQQVSFQEGAGLPVAPRFNFASENFYQRPDERYTGGVFAHYDLGYKDTLYFDLMYTDDRSLSQIAPSGNFFNTTLISCDNPFLSAQQRDIICTSRGFDLNDDAIFRIGRRNVEGNPRQSVINHKSIRASLGAQGDFRLLRGFEYDISGQVSSTQLKEAQINDISKRKLQRALLVTTDANGRPVCDSVLDGSDPNCIPINYFAAGGVTQAAVDYISAGGTQNGTYNQSIALASLSGDLSSYGWQFPSAKRGVEIVLGSEFRVDDYTLETSDEFSSGDLAGLIEPVPRLSGNFHSWELFAELQIPLISDQNFAKDLTLKGAFRFADNSLSGGASSYAGGAMWQINNNVRLRGQYQRAVRVANAVELFTPTELLFASGFQDPCQGVAPTASQIQCANSGVSSAQYGSIPINPAGRLNLLTGGNQNLSPESSDTFTLGAIVQFPSALSGLNMSVDYFDITVKDFIGRVAPSRALNGCVEDNNPLLCALVNRDPATGALWTNDNAFIANTNVNTGSLQTSGFDFSASYASDLPIGWGGINLQFNGTYLTSLSTQALPNDPLLECAGLYGSECGTPNPRWRHIAAAAWHTDNDFDAKLSWRHFSSVAAAPSLDAESGSFDEKLSAADYFDIALTYRGLPDVTLRLGVNNIFDKEPPVSSSVGAGFGNGNTFPQVYDALGRFLFARVTVDY